MAWPLSWHLRPKRGPRPKSYTKSPSVTTKLNYGAIYSIQSTESPRGGVGIGAKSAGLVSVAVVPFLIAKKYLITGNDQENTGYWDLR